MSNQSPGDTKARMSHNWISGLYYELQRNWKQGIWSKRSQIQWAFIYQQTLKILKNRKKIRSSDIYPTHIPAIRHMLLWTYKSGWMLRTKHKSSNWDARRILPRIGSLSEKRLIQLLKILYRNLNCAVSGNKKTSDTWLFDLQWHAADHTP